MADEKILGAGEDGAGEDGEEIKHDTVLTGDENAETKDEETKDEETKDDEKKGKEKKLNADDGPKDGDADKGEEGKVIEYEDFNTPDGVELDKDALAEFVPLVKEMGLSQEHAQSLIDLQLKFSQQVVEDQAKAWSDLKSQWTKAAESDPEYGKGAYDASVLTARKAMREVGTPELQKALEETGMGNHPEFIRFFYRVGKAIGEDSLSFGGAGKGTPKTAAERMFPNQGKS